MTEAEAKQALAREGYTNIYTWFDSPDDEYEPHVHPQERKHIVVEGSLELTLDGSTHHYQTGDMYTILAQVEHSAQIGPKGCMYVVGEKS